MKDTPFCPKMKHKRKHVSFEFAKKNVNNAWQQRIGSNDGGASCTRVHLIRETILCCIRSWPLRRHRMAQARGPPTTPYPGSVVCSGFCRLILQRSGCLREAQVERHLLQRDTFCSAKIYRTDTASLCVRSLSVSVLSLREFRYMGSLVLENVVLWKLEFDLLVMHLFSF